MTMDRLNADTNSLVCGNLSGIRQDKGSQRVSRKLAALRCIQQAHEDGYNVCVSRNLSKYIRRYILESLRYHRSTPRFAEEIHNKILSIHDYNCKLAELKGKYPRSRYLRLLLARYVELELEILYQEENISKQYETTVENRILHLLQFTLYDVVYNPEATTKSNIVTTCVAVLKFFTYVALNLSQKQRKKFKILNSMVNKMTQKVGDISSLTDLVRKQCDYGSDGSGSDSDSDDQLETSDSGISVNHNTSSVRHGRERYQSRRIPKNEYSSREGTTDQGFNQREFSRPPNEIVVDYVDLNSSDDDDNVLKVTTIDLLDKDSNEYLIYWDKEVKTHNRKSKPTCKNITRDRSLYKTKLASSEQATVVITSDSDDDLRTLDLRGEDSSHVNSYNTPLDLSHDTHSSDSIRSVEVSKIPSSNMQKMNMLYENNYRLTESLEVALKFHSHGITTRLVEQVVNDAISTLSETLTKHHDIITRVDGYAQSAFDNIATDISQTSTPVPVDNLNRDICQDVYPSAISDELASSTDWTAVASESEYSVLSPQTPITHEQTYIAEENVVTLSDEHDLNKHIEIQTEVNVDAVAQNETIPMDKITQERNNDFVTHQIDDYCLEVFESNSRNSYSTQAVECDSQSNCSSLGEHTVDRQTENRDVEKVDEYSSKSLDRISNINQFENFEMESCTTKELGTEGCSIETITMASEIDVNSSISANVEEVASCENSPYDKNPATTTSCVEVCLEDKNVECNLSTVKESAPLLEPADFWESYNVVCKTGSHLQQIPPTSVITPTTSYDETHSFTDNAESSVEMVDINCETETTKAITTNELSNNLTSEGIEVSVSENPPARRKHQMISSKEKASEVSRKTCSEGMKKVSFKDVVEDISNVPKINHGVRKRSSNVQSMIASAKKLKSCLVRPKTDTTLLHNLRSHTSTNDAANEMTQSINSADLSCVKKRASKTSSKSSKRHRYGKSSAAHKNKKSKCISSEDDKDVSTDAKSFEKQKDATVKQIETERKSSSYTSGNQQLLLHRYNSSLRDDLEVSDTQLSGGELTIVSEGEIDTQEEITVNTDNPKQEDENCVKHPLQSAGQCDTASHTLTDTRVQLVPDDFLDPYNAMCKNNPTLESKFQGDDLSDGRKSGPNSWDNVVPEKAFSMKKEKAMRAKNTWSSHVENIPLIQEVGTVETEVIYQENNVNIPLTQEIAQVSTVESELIYQGSNVHTEELDFVTQHNDEGSGETGCGILIEKDRSDQIPGSPLLQKQTFSLEGSSEIITEGEQSPEKFLSPEPFHENLISEQESLRKQKCDDSLDPLEAHAEFAVETISTKTTAPTHNVIQHLETADNAKKLNLHASDLNLICDNVDEVYTGLERNSKSSERSSIHVDPQTNLQALNVEETKFLSLESNEWNSKSIEKKNRKRYPRKSVQNVPHARNKITQEIHSTLIDKLQPDVLETQEKVQPVLSIGKTDNVISCKNNLETVGKSSNVKHPHRKYSDGEILSDIAGHFAENLSSLEKRKAGLPEGYSVSSGTIDRGSRRRSRVKWSLRKYSEAGIIYKDIVGDNTLKFNELTEQIEESHSEKTQPVDRSRKRNESNSEIVAKQDDVAIVNEENKLEATKQTNLSELERIENECVNRFELGIDLKPKNQYPIDGKPIVTKPPKKDKTKLLQAQRILNSSVHESRTIPDSSTSIERVQAVIKGDKNVRQIETKSISEVTILNMGEACATKDENGVLPKISQMHSDTKITKKSRKGASKLTGISKNKSLFKRHVCQKTGSKLAKIVNRDDCMKHESEDIKRVNRKVMRESLNKTGSNTSEASTKAKKPRKRHNNAPVTPLNAISPVPASKLEQTYPRLGCKRGKIQKTMVDETLTNSASKEPVREKLISHEQNQKLSGKDRKKSSTSTDRAKSLQTSPSVDMEHFNKNPDCSRHNSERLLSKQHTSSDSKIIDNKQTNIKSKNFNRRRTRSSAQLDPYVLLEYNGVIQFNGKLETDHGKSNRTSSEKQERTHEVTDTKFDKNKVSSTETYRKTEGAHGLSQKSSHRASRTPSKSSGSIHASEASQKCALVVNVKSTKKSVLAAKKEINRVDQLDIEVNGAQKETKTGKQVGPNDKCMPDNTIEAQEYTHLRKMKYRRQSMYEPEKSSEIGNGRKGKTHESNGNERANSNNRTHENKMDSQKIRDTKKGTELNTKSDASDDNSALHEKAKIGEHKDKKTIKYVNKEHEDMSGINVYRKQNKDNKTNVDELLHNQTNDEENNFNEQPAEIIAPRNKEVETLNEETKSEKGSEAHAKEKEHISSDECCKGLRMENSQELILNQGLNERDNRKNDLSGSTDTQKRAADIDHDTNKSHLSHGAEQTLRNEKVLAAGEGNIEERDPHSQEESGCLKYADKVDAIQKVGNKNREANKKNKMEHILKKKGNKENVSDMKLRNREVPESGKKKTDVNAEGIFPDADSVIKILKTDVQAKLMDRPVEANTSQEKTNDEMLDKTATTTDDKEVNDGNVCVNTQKLDQICLDRADHDTFGDNHNKTNDSNLEKLTKKHVEIQAQEAVLDGKVSEQTHNGENKKPDSVFHEVVGNTKLIRDINSKSQQRSKSEQKKKDVKKDKILHGSLKKISSKKNMANKIKKVSKTVNKICDKPDAVQNTYVEIKEPSKGVDVSHREQISVEKTDSIKYDESRKRKPKAADTMSVHKIFDESTHRKHKGYQDTFIDVKQDKIPNEITDKVDKKNIENDQKSEKLNDKIKETGKGVDASHREQISVEKADGTKYDESRKQKRKAADKKSVHKIFDESTHRKDKGYQDTFIDVKQDKIPNEITDKVDKKYIENDQKSEKLDDKIKETGKGVDASHREQISVEKADGTKYDESRKQKRKAADKKSVHKIFDESTHRKDKGYQDTFMDVKQDKVPNVITDKVDKKNIENAQKSGTLDDKKQKSPNSECNTGNPEATIQTHEEGVMHKTVVITNRELHCDLQIGNTETSISGSLTINDTIEIEVASDDIEHESSPSLRVSNEKSISRENEATEDNLSEGIHTHSETKLPHVTDEKTNKQGDNIDISDHEMENITSDDIKHKSPPLLRVTNEKTISRENEATEDHLSEGIHTHSEKRLLHVTDEKTNTEGDSIKISDHEIVNITSDDIKHKSSPSLRVSNEKSISRENEATEDNVSEGIHTHSETILPHVTNDKITKQGNNIDISDREIVNITSDDIKHKSPPSLRVTNEKSILREIEATEYNVSEGIHAHSETILPHVTNDKITKQGDNIDISYLEIVNITSDDIKHSLSTSPRVPDEKSISHENEATKDNLCEGIHTHSETKLPRVTNDKTNKQGDNIYYIPDQEIVNITSADIKHNSSASPRVPDEKSISHENEATKDNLCEGIHTHSETKLLHVTDEKTNKQGDNINISDHEIVNITSDDIKHKLSPSLIVPNEKTISRENEATEDKLSEGIHTHSETKLPHVTNDKTNKQGDNIDISDHEIINITSDDIKHKSLTSLTVVNEKTISRGNEATEDDLSEGIHTHSETKLPHVVDEKTNKQGDNINIADHEIEIITADNNAGHAQEQCEKQIRNEICVEESLETNVQVNLEEDGNIAKDAKINLQNTEVPTNSFNESNVEHDDVPLLTPLPENTTCINEVNITDPQRSMESPEDENKDHFKNDIHMSGVCDGNLFKDSQNVSTNTCIANKGASKQGSEVTLCHFEIEDVTVMSDVSFGEEHCVQHVANEVCIEATQESASETAEHVSLNETTQHADKSSNDADEHSHKSSDVPLEENNTTQDMCVKNSTSVDEKLNLQNSDEDASYSNEVTVHGDSTLIPSNLQSSENSEKLNSNKCEGSNQELPGSVDQEHENDTKNVHTSEMSNISVLEDNLSQGSQNASAECYITDGTAEKQEGSINMVNCEIENVTIIDNTPTVEEKCIKQTEDEICDGKLHETSTADPVHQEENSPNQGVNVEKIASVNTQLNSQNAELDAHYSNDVSLDSTLPKCRTSSEKVNKKKRKRSSEEIKLEEQQINKKHIRNEDHSFITDSVASSRDSRKSPTKTAEQRDTNKITQKINETIERVKKSLDIETCDDVSENTDEPDVARETCSIENPKSNQSESVVDIDEFDFSLGCKFPNESLIIQSPAKVIEETVITDFHIDIDNGELQDTVDVQSVAPINLDFNRCENVENDSFSEQTIDNHVDLLVPEFINQDDMICGSLVPATEITPVTSINASSFDNTSLSVLHPMTPASSCYSPMSYTSSAANGCNMATITTTASRGGQCAESSSGRNVPIVAEGASLFDPTAGGPGGPMITQGLPLERNILVPNSLSDSTEEFTSNDNALCDLSFNSSTLIEEEYLPGKENKQEFDGGVDFKIIEAPMDTDSINTSDICTDPTDPAKATEFAISNLVRLVNQNSVDSNMSAPMSLSDISNINFLVHVVDSSNNQETNCTDSKGNVTEKLKTPEKVVNNLFYSTPIKQVQEQRVIVEKIEHCPSTNYLCQKTETVMPLPSAPPAEKTKPTKKVMPQKPENSSKLDIKTVTYGIAARLEYPSRKHTRTPVIAPRKKKPIETLNAKQEEKVSNPTLVTAETSDTTALDCSSKPEQQGVRSKVDSWKTAAERKAFSEPLLSPLGASTRKNETVIVKSSSKATPEPDQVPSSSVKPSKIAEVEKVSDYTGSVFDSVKLKKRTCANKAITYSIDSILQPDVKYTRGKRRIATEAKVLKDKCVQDSEAIRKRKIKEEDKPKLNEFTKQPKNSKADPNVKRIKTENRKDTDAIFDKLYQQGPVNEIYNVTRHRRDSQSQRTEALQSVPSSRYPKRHSLQEGNARRDYSSSDPGHCSNASRFRNHSRFNAHQSSYQEKRHSSDHHVLNYKHPSNNNSSSHRKSDRSHVLHSQSADRHKNPSEDKLNSLFTLPARGGQRSQDGQDYDWWYKISSHIDNPTTNLFSEPRLKRK